MKTTAIRLALAVLLIGANSAGAWPIEENEHKYQSQNFEKWWGTELVWRFDDLPADASVPEFRYPYSGAIYPDGSGGTAAVLRKYDQAFHNGQRLAESFEYRDIEVHKRPTVRRGGLFGLRRRNVNATPHWAGHCNGWAAAAIRHAEPAENVTRNGVVFTPSDIKGLLAELYTYTEIEHLGGVDSAINPGTLHVVVANWVGLKKYPIAMDSTVGREVWNYPLYAYRSTTTRRSDGQVEVKLNLGYVNYTNREHDKGPKNYRYMYFHYVLELDEEGRITGGRYYGDSNRVDMLWVPLAPTPGGEEGNEPGNPHLDVAQVLALWRDSAAEDLRKKWFTVDAAEEDRVTLEEAEQLAEGGESGDDSSAAAGQDAAEGGEVAASSGG